MKVLRLSICPFRLEKSNIMFRTQFLSLVLPIKFLRVCMCACVCARVHMCVYIHYVAIISTIIIFYVLAHAAVQKI